MFEAPQLLSRQVVPLDTPLAKAILKDTRISLDGLLIQRRVSLSAGTLQADQLKFNDSMII
jgi:hypothetical protein